MAEPEEKTLSWRAPQVTEYMEDVVWIEPQLLSKMPGLLAEHKLLFDPRALRLVEQGELSFELRIAIDERFIAPRG